MEYNRQVALEVAATVWSGAMGHGVPARVIEDAEKYLAWLEAVPEPQHPVD